MASDFRLLTSGFWLLALGDRLGTLSRKSKVIAGDAEVLGRMPPSSYVRIEREQPPNLGEFHAAGVPMWIFDRKTLTILEVNEAATQLYGYSRSEFLRMTILDIRPLEDIPKVLQSTLRAPGYHSHDHTWRHQRKDGSVFQAKVSGWEISFDGRAAELVLAEPVRAASA